MTTGAAVSDFRMCKYCGHRINPTRAYSRAGIRSPDGVYCTAQCSYACHGFDRHLAWEGEIGGKISLSCIANMGNPTAHSTECSDACKMAACLLIVKSATVDPRLPAILIAIANGQTLAQAGKPWNITAPAVAYLMNKLRANV